MVDENSNPTEGSTTSENPGTPDPTQEPDGEEPLKGGADGKTKALGGKGLGDHVKADPSERAYE